MEKRVKVVYDDKCPTCSVGMNLAEKLDSGTMQFVGMNTAAGQELIATHSLDMSHSAYVIDGDHIAQKAEFMRIVFGTSFLGSIIALPFRIPYVGTWIYNVLALHRAHVTKTKT